MSEHRGGLVMSVAGCLMACLAAALLLYTAAVIFVRSLLPALRAGEPELARIAVLGFDFSGLWVLVPSLAYLLLGFVALAMARRQGRRAIAIWRG